MTELNRTLKEQLDQVLGQSEESPFDRFHRLVQAMLEKRETKNLFNWKRAGQLYIEGAREMPLCMKLAMLDELEATINPVFRLLPCGNYNAESDSCNLGFDCENNLKTCPQYTPKSNVWAGYCKEGPCTFCDKGCTCPNRGGELDA